MERVIKYDKTVVYDSFDDEGIENAAKHLREGEVVGFPTETVYGLGANALSEDAVAEIFKAKGRPGDNPLIVHISDKSQIAELVSEITPLAQKLIDAFMPGPVTVIMKKSSIIPDNVTAGLDTVGIRMPVNPVAQKFLSFCKCPVAAPSANLSGSPSPTKASHVFKDMNKYIYAIIDGGESDYGLESTVIDATGETPVILRPGAVTQSQVDEVCNVKTESRLILNEGETPKAPGMKYRHYAPKAEVMIMDFPQNLPLTGDEDTLSIKNTEEESEETDFESLSDDEKEELFSIAKPYLLKTKELLSANPLTRVGLFCGEEVRLLFEKLGDNVLLSHTNFFVYGKSCDVSAASHGLFDGLRTLDLQEVDYILASGFGGEGLSKAYMNRLSKAAVKNGDLPDSLKAEKSFEVSGKDYKEDDSFGIMTASVLFVCDSNRSLSIAAESVFSDLISRKGPFCSSKDHKTEGELYCESAGLYAYDGEAISEDTEKAVKEVLGKDIGYMSTKRVSVDMYDASDLVFAMRDEQAEEIVRAFPEMRGKVFSMYSYAVSKGLVIKDDKGRTVSISVPDPQGESYPTHLHTVRAVEAYLKLLFPYILVDLGLERA